jgi:hypothetical protein
VLFFVDITMSTPEVTLGQDVKENIGGIFGKGDGILHVLVRISLSRRYEK